jgi:hypothetical protein
MIFVDSRQSVPELQQYKRYIEAEGIRGPRVSRQAVNIVVDSGGIEETMLLRESLASRVAYVLRELDSRPERARFLQNVLSKWEFFAPADLQSGLSGDSDPSMFSRVVRREDYDLGS